MSSRIASSNSNRRRSEAVGTRNPTIAAAKQHLPVTESPLAKRHPEQERTQGRSFSKVVIDLPITYNSLTSLYRSEVTKQAKQREGSPELGSISTDDEDPVVVRGKRARTSDRKLSREEPLQRPRSLREKRGEPTSDSGSSSTEEGDRQFTTALGKRFNLQSTSGVAPSGAVRTGRGFSNRRVSDVLDAEEEVALRKMVLKRRKYTSLTMIDKLVFDEVKNRMWWEFGLFVDAFPSEGTASGFMIQLWTDGSQTLHNIVKQYKENFTPPGEILLAENCNIPYRLLKSMGNNRAARKERFHQTVMKVFPKLAISLEPTEEQMEVVKMEVSALLGHVDPSLYFAITTGRSEKYRYTNKWLPKVIVTNFLCPNMNAYKEPMEFINRLNSRFVALVFAMMEINIMESASGKRVVPKRANMGSNPLKSKVEAIFAEDRAVESDIEDIDELDEEDEMELLDIFENDIAQTAKKRRETAKKGRPVRGKRSKIQRNRKEVDNEAVLSEDEDEDEKHVTTALTSDDDSDSTAPSPNASRRNVKSNLKNSQNTGFEVLESEYSSDEADNSKKSDTEAEASGLENDTKNLLGGHFDSEDELSD
ncbi:hypothetical protein BJ508DRAFT_305547 [Ascobolus immersus RN42]|uniref:DUF6532 domain-containing protein n=1 Tax=Ascobolus immersus RN42 TaxID=1160509 RepID=A0A3N4I8K7_ASCIM|nr:hypothetical protein BJ508DRAFT_305547 [Ascobolus immersus RN42]